jgi:hypothetical protein
MFLEFTDDIVFLPIEHVNPRQVYLASAALPAQFDIRLCRIPVLTPVTQGPLILVLLKQVYLISRSTPLLDYSRHAC